MRYSALLAPFLLAAVTAACGDSTTEPETPAFEYKMNVKGAVSATASGPAVFGTSEESGEPAFAIVLGEDTARYVFVIGKTGTERPAVGTYNVAFPGGGGWGAAMIVAEGDELVAMFMSQSGKLMITESSPTRVRGRVMIEATGFVGEDPGQVSAVTIEGDFDARPAPVQGTLRAARR